MKSDRPDIRSFIVPFDENFIPDRCGWWNGYVAIPKYHPYYWIDYRTLDDEIIAFTNFFVHWGLTFASHLSKLSPEYIQQYIDQNAWATAEDDVWIIWFDTVHPWDNKKEWTKDAVADHTIELKKAVTKCWDAPLPPNREHFNDSKKYYLEDVKSSCKSRFFYQVMDWLQDQIPNELLAEVYLAKTDELYKLYVQHCNTLGVEPEDRDEMLDGKEMNEILEEFNYVYSYTRFDPEYISPS